MRHCPRCILRFCRLRDQAANRLSVGPRRRDLLIRLRQQILIDYLPLLRVWLARNRLYDELGEAALILADALGDYDPQTRMAFVTFVRIRLRRQVRAGCCIHPVLKWRVYCAAKCVEEARSLYPSGPEATPHKIIDELSRLGRRLSLPYIVSGCRAQRVLYSIPLPLVSAADSRTPQELAISREQRNRLVQALDGLAQREREIVRAHFGIDQRSETLDSIGTRLGISRERVRQLETSTLAKLRQSLQILHDDFRQDCVG